MHLSHNEFKYIIVKGKYFYNDFEIKERFIYLKTKFKKKYKFKNIFNF